MPDPRLVEQLANALGTQPSLVEKDWHIVRAIGVLATLDHGAARPAFSGGTSLSMAWGLIKRFSEDIDFKIAMPAAGSSLARTQRRDYREKILESLSKADLTLMKPPSVGNESQFVTADFAYASELSAAPGLRPHLRIELSFQPPVLASIERPIQSLLSRAQRQAPEIQAFPCIDPIETAADKLSALAWRVCTRQRGTANDDPTIIRHLHDLAALEARASAAPAFLDVLQKAAAADTGRGGGQVPSDPSDRFAMMLERLHTDKLWAGEYDEFVRNVSFARADEMITFDAAREAVTRLVNLYRQSKGIEA